MIRTGGLFVALVIAVACSTITVSDDGSPAGRRVASRHKSGRVQPAVDQVTLKTGKTLRGAIAHLDANGALTLAVSREWLHKAGPDLFAKRTRAEAAARRAALEQLRGRLDQERVGVSDDSRLGAFLRSEHKRIVRLLAEAAPADGPQFVWLDLAKKEIAKIKPVTPEKRRIAAWSWSERLANVETRNADDLARRTQTERGRSGPASARPRRSLSASPAGRPRMGRSTNGVSRLRAR